MLFPIVPWNHVCKQDTLLGWLLARVHCVICTFSLIVLLLLCSFPFGLFASR
ncbi:hypothetical protein LZ32DRAFT_255406 [Colletotrichum eremochloae]|nr:hypothetical protein LZ32DRAFT_255406 [Colletotrichum eremochloae]